MFSKRVYTEVTVFMKTAVSGSSTSSMYSDSSNCCAVRAVQIDFHGLGGFKNNAQVSLLPSFLAVAPK